MRAVLSVRRDELKTRSSIFFFSRPANEWRARCRLARHASDLIILRVTSAFILLCVRGRSGEHMRASVGAEHRAAADKTAIRFLRFLNPHARGGGSRRRKGRGERYNFISLSWIRGGNDFPFSALTFPRKFVAIIFINSRGRKSM